MNDTRLELLCERAEAGLARDEELAELAACAEVSTVLSAALAEERGPSPDVWPSVALQLGWDPEAVPGWSGQLLREAVLDEAGSVNVAPAVLEAIRPRVAPAAEPELPAWRRWWQSLAMPALGFATAAALLLSFPSAPTGGGLAMMVDLPPVNHVQIEDISSDSPDMVSVMQFDDDAPTIIFIDEASAEDEGATL